MKIRKSVAILAAVGMCLSFQAGAVLAGETEDESVPVSEEQTESGSSQSEEKGRVGIISAMENEISLLMKNTEVERIDHIGPWDFYVGTLCGRDVVIVKAGVGKVRSASGAATMLNSYDISEVYFTGIAGGAGEETQLLDVVIATDLVQHDYGLISDEGFVWLPRSGGLLGYYYCDPELVSLAHDCAEQIVGEEHVFEGTIATGDQFVASDSYIEELRKNFNALACEMEGASVAAVCTDYEIPFVVIRTMSDKADGDAVQSELTWGDDAADHSSKIIMRMLEE